jgi:hypothetical protein
MESWDVSEKLPSVRYHKLAEHFKNNPMPSVDDPDEAFELVDVACKRLFGLRMAEEIQEDLEHSERLVETYRKARQNITGPGAQLNPVPLLAELVEYRRLLFSGFKRYARAFCTAQGFYEHTAPILRPSIIYHIPAGSPLEIRVSFSSLGEEWIGLIDRRPKPPKNSLAFQELKSIVYAVWSPLPGENGSDGGRLSTVVEQRERGIGWIDNALLASRQGVYGLLGPLYRWILYGNKYRSMSEVENDSLPDALGLDRGRFVLDPVYQDAEDISLPDAFLDFFHRDKNYCDVCGAEVKRGDSYLVSARTMRQNSEVVKYYQSLGPDYEFKFLKLDWSEWLLCLTDMERFGFPIPRRTFTNEGS